MTKEKRKMMRFSTIFFTSLTVVMSQSTIVCAIPVTLNETQFLTASSGLTTVTEDFETFDVGYLPSPVTLANSSYTAQIPQIRLNETGNPTKTLFENAPDPASGRVFSSFLPNTILFGTVLNDVALNSGVLDINVIGVSGAINLQASFASLGCFFGVSDSLGLISVSFRNLGYEGYSAAWGLDNVTTAAIPEPSAASLIGLGALAAFVARCKRNK